MRGCGERRAVADVAEHDGEEKGEEDDREDARIDLAVSRHAVGVDQSLQKADEEVGRGGRARSGEIEGGRAPTGEIGADREGGRGGSKGDRAWKADEKLPVGRCEGGGSAPLHGWRALPSSRMLRMGSVSPPVPGG